MHIPSQPKAARGGEESSMDKLNWVTRACGIFLLWATAAIALPAQTTGGGPPAPIFTLLHSFGMTGDGASPYAGLAQGTDGNFYGTTESGGANRCFAEGCGTVFRITPGGTLTTLHSFDSADGAGPIAGLLQASDGNFYGTAPFGGPNNSRGTVFKITPSGTLTTLHGFCYLCAEGNEPRAGLIVGTDGNFYGTTGGGGANGDGTVFKITPSGTLTTLHSFDSTDGASPVAALVLGTDGNFYGTTQFGGANIYGTVFKITPSGTLTTLHNFNGTNGAVPYAGLVQATDGNFYGTTDGGGADDYGTVFKITPRGKLTTLNSFDNADGSFPMAGLVQGTDGNFYGTTQEGGAVGSCGDGCGTVFRITPGGTLTTLHSFDLTDGEYPLAGLVQGTNGTFYGTTAEGGASGGGTVFSLFLGLRSFVETLPVFGKVGTPVHILGTNLIGATSVTFNGTPATFTVVSKTLIFTNVPAGATTGTVQVVTPGGTLSSNVPFQVLP